MIGVFDSGVGGLTVLSAMRRVYPSIDVVYFGDTKHAPYGLRSREELSALTVAGIRFLLEEGASTIVSACNSVSTQLALSIYDVLDLSETKIIEMVGPCVSAFKGSNARIALVATIATIESGQYQSAFRMIGKEITAVPIPGLAGAIEAGEGTASYEQHIRQALTPIDPDSFDVLILACTHYPLAMDSFRAVLPASTIFDPAEAVAERVLKERWPREMGYGTSTYYVSKDSRVFRSFVQDLFPHAAADVRVIENA